MFLTSLQHVPVLLPNFPDLLLDVPPWPPDSILDLELLNAPVGNKNIIYIPAK